MIIIIIIIIIDYFDDQIDEILNDNWDFYKEKRKGTKVLIL